MAAGWRAAREIQQLFQAGIAMETPIGGRFTKGEDHGGCRLHVLLLKQASERKEQNTRTKISDRKIQMTKRAACRAALG